MSNFSLEDKHKLELLWSRLKSIGSTGELVGPAGPVGPQGAAGADGADGAPGAAGEDGLVKDWYLASDYGAVPNTGVDASAGINAAVQAAGLNGGGKVYVESGEHTMYSDIVVNHNNVSIIGAGAATVLRPAPGVSGINGIVLADVDDCMVANLSIKDITDPGGAEKWGIQCYGGNRNIIAHNWIDNCDDAGISVRYDTVQYFSLSHADRFDVSKVNDGYGHVVMGNIITNISEGSGIELYRSENLVVSGNTIDNVLEHGIRSICNSGSVITDNVVRRARNGISIQGAGTGGMTPGYTTMTKTTNGLVVSGNNIFAATGIQMHSGHENVLVTDNIVKCDPDGTAPYYGLYLPYTAATVILLDGLTERNVKFSNNIVTGFSNGFYCTDRVHDVTVENNVFEDFGYAGVYFNTDSFGEDSTGIVVKGNIIRGGSGAPDNGINKIGVAFDGADKVYAYLSDNTILPYGFDDVTYTWNPASVALIDRPIIKTAPFVPAHFGVIADGTNDDTKAMNYLIEVANDFTRACIYFSPGTYNVSSWTTINNTVLLDGDIPDAVVGGHARVCRGTASPEGAVVATTGSVYLRRGGAAGTSVYIKESGTGNTGWVALNPSVAPAHAHELDELNATGITDGYILTSDGAGGAAWEDPPFAPAVKPVTTVSSSPYTVLSTDRVLDVTYSATGITLINLGSLSPSAGHELFVVDSGGNAFTNNITLYGATIDGATGYSIRADWGTVRLLYTGTQWVILNRSAVSGYDRCFTPGYTDMIVAANAVKLSTNTYPDTDAWGSLEMISFAPGVGNQYVFISLQTPHGYVAGSEWRPHIHFAAPDAIPNGATVGFELLYRKASVDSVLSTEATVTMLYTNTTGSAVAAGTHLIAGNATIAGTGLGASAVLYGRVRRAAGDTHTGDVYFLSMDAHIAVDRLGSEDYFSG